VTQAGWLLFAKVPPVWSYVRYLRYAGSTAETGVRSNLTEDIRLDGNTPSLIEQARELLPDKIGSVIRLAASGRFERMPVLPEFAWLEAVVNAVTHRSYSMQGDGVRVIQFEDRIVVESPGRLPGLVRVENIRNCRFARNPHIARVLAEMTGYVRELNEGVRRMFEEMARHGLPAPFWTVTDAGVRVTLYTQPQGGIARAETLPESLTVLNRRLGGGRLVRLLGFLRTEGEVKTREVAAFLSVTVPTARGYLMLLRDAGMLAQQGTWRGPTSTWIATDSPLWSEGSLESYLKGSSFK
jgi:ATP-dependent DNA helicase RecG